MPARRDCQPNLQKVTPIKEKVIVAHVLDLNLQGFLLSLNAVQAMANKLLAERDTKLVGQR